MLRIPLAVARALYILYILAAFPLICLSQHAFLSLADPPNSLHIQVCVSDTDEVSKAAGACHFVTARGPLLHIGGNGRCVTNKSPIPKLTLQQQRRVRVRDGWGRGFGGDGRGGK